MAKRKSKAKVGNGDKGSQDKSKITGIEFTVTGQGIQAPRGTSKSTQSESEFTGIKIKTPDMLGNTKVISPNIPETAIAKTCKKTSHEKESDGPKNQEIQNSARRSKRSRKPAWKTKEMQQDIRDNKDRPKSAGRKKPQNRDKEQMIEDSHHDISVDMNTTFTISLNNPDDSGTKAADKKNRPKSSCKHQAQQNPIEQKVKEITHIISQNVPEISGGSYKSPQGTKNRSLKISLTEVEKSQVSGCNLKKKISPKAKAVICKKRSPVNKERAKRYISRKRKIRSAELVGKFRQKKLRSNQSRGNNELWEGLPFNLQMPRGKSGSESQGSAGVKNHEGCETNKNQEGSDTRGEDQYQEEIQQCMEDRAYDGRNTYIIKTIQHNDVAPSVSTVTTATDTKKVKKKRNKQKKKAKNKDLEWKDECNEQYVNENPAWEIAERSDITKEQIHSKKSDSIENSTTDRSMENKIVKTVGKLALRLKLSKTPVIIQEEGCVNISDCDSEATVSCEEDSEIPAGRGEQGEGCNQCNTVLLCDLILGGTMGRDPESPETKPGVKNTTFTVLKTRHAEDVESKSESSKADEKTTLILSSSCTDQDISKTEFKSGRAIIESNLTKSEIKTEKDNTLNLTRFIEEEQMLSDDEDKLFILTDEEEADDEGEPDKSDKQTSVQPKKKDRKAVKSRSRESILKVKLPCIKNRTPANAIHPASEADVDSDFSSDNDDFAQPSTKLNTKTKTGVNQRKLDTPRPSSVRPSVKFSIGINKDPVLSTSLLGVQQKSSPDTARTSPKEQDLMVPVGSSGMVPGKRRKWRKLLKGQEGKSSESSPIPTSRSAPLMRKSRQVCTQQKLFSPESKHRNVRRVASEGRVPNQREKTAGRTIQQRSKSQTRLPQSSITDLCGLSDKDAPSDAVRPFTRRQSMDSDNPSLLDGLGSRKKGVSASQSEMLADKHLGMQACSLWSSENRRHYQMIHAGITAEQLELLMRSSWEQLSDREKLTYYRRAKNATSINKNTSVPTTQRTRKKKATKTKEKQPSTSTQQKASTPAPDLFYNMTQHQQTEYLKAKLINFQATLSSYHYNKFIHEFLTAFKRSVQYKLKKKLKILDDPTERQLHFESVSRRMLYNKMEQYDGFVAEVQKHRQYLAYKEYKLEYDCLLWRSLRSDNLAEIPDMAWAGNLANLLAAISNVEEGDADRSQVMTSRGPPNWVKGEGDSIRSTGQRCACRSEEERRAVQEIAEELKVHCGRNTPSVNSYTSQAEGPNGSNTSQAELSMDNITLETIPQVSMYSQLNQQILSELDPGVPLPELTKEEVTEFLDDLRHQHEDPSFQHDTLRRQCDDWSHHCDDSSYQCVALSPRCDDILYAGPTPLEEARGATYRSLHGLEQCCSLEDPSCVLTSLLVDHMMEGQCIE